MRLQVNKLAARLEVVLRVRLCLEHTDLAADELARARPRRNALHVRLLTLLLRLVLDRIVFPDTLQEVLVAPRLPHVFDAHVQALAELTVLYHLRLLNAYRGLGDVEDDPGLAVVLLVGHTGLDRRIRLNVDEIPPAVDRKVASQSRKTLHLVRLGELVARARAKTVVVRHG